MSNKKNSSEFKLYIQSSSYVYRMIALKKMRIALIISKLFKISIIAPLKHKFPISYFSAPNVFDYAISIQLNYPKRKNLKKSNPTKLLKNRSAIIVIIHTLVITKIWYTSTRLWIYIRANVQ